MQPGDRVIVCLAAPVWVHAHKYRQFGGSFDETDLLYLRDEIFARRGVQMKVFLVGRLPSLPAPRRDGAARTRLADSEDHGWRRRRVPPPDARRGRHHARGGAREAGRATAALRAENDVPGRRAVRIASATGTCCSCSRIRALVSFPLLIYLMTVWLVSAAIVHPQPAGSLRHWPSRHGPAIGTRPDVMGPLPPCSLRGLHRHTLEALSVIGGAHSTAHWSAMFAIGWAALAAKSLSPAWPFIRLSSWACSSALAGGSRLDADGPVPADFVERLRPA